jgi:hypothetical protein
VGAARREKLLARLRAAIPRFLEPGERPVAATQVLVSLSPASVVAVAGVLIVGVGIASAAIMVLDGIWEAGVFGGLIGGTVATMSSLSSRWIVVTDRRLLVLPLSLHNAEPRALERADPLSSVRVVSSQPRWGGIARATIARADGPELSLRSIRLWAPDLAAVVTVLSAPPPPASGTPPMPPPPGP